MYGFSGYGTNTYASERQTGMFGPIVRLGVRTLANGYNTALALMLRFRSLTLSNPSANNDQTLEL